MLAAMGPGPEPCMIIGSFSDLNRTASLRKVL